MRVRLFANAHSLHVEIQSPASLVRSAEKNSCNLLAAEGSKRG